MEQSVRSFFVRKITAKLLCLRPKKLELYEKYGTIYKKGIKRGIADEK